MSAQKEVLRHLARRLNAGEIAGLEDCFTADFRLHDPAAPDFPTGLEGARRMISAFASMQGVDLQILDLIEEGDRVAVRWGVSWTETNGPRVAAIMSIYRFDQGKIAEDWGVSARLPWL